MIFKKLFILLLVCLASLTCVSLSQAGVVPDKACSDRINAAYTDSLEASDREVLWQSVVAEGCLAANPALAYQDESIVDCVVSSQEAVDWNTLALENKAAKTKKYNTKIKNNLSQSKKILSKRKKINKIFRTGKVGLAQSLFKRYKKNLKKNKAFFTSLHKSKKELSSRYEKDHQAVLVSLYSVECLDDPNLSPGFLEVPLTREEVILKYSNRF